MSYSTEIAEALTQTLARFATLNPHQLAGHVANLDFWLAETRHCVDVIEGYNKRFEGMKAAHVRYAAERQTLEYHYICEDYCPICGKGTPVAPPKRVPHGALNGALRELRDAAYHFLVRSYKAGFIDEARLREAADSIGTGVDVSDLQR